MLFNLFGPKKSMTPLPAEVRGFICSATYDGMASTFLDGLPEDSSGAKNDLIEHFAMLRRMFSGRSELELYHALLTVLIRRKIGLVANVGRFRELWCAKGEFLCSNLNSKWLRSACDTIVDHGETLADRSLALVGSVFTNTIKVYETERWMAGDSALSYQRIPETTVPLHDGLTVFKLGHGDMIHNLYRRAEEVAAIGGVSGAIVIEILRRAKKHDTAFKRFRDRHQNTSTLW